MEPPSESPSEPPPPTAAPPSPAAADTPATERYGAPWTEGVRLFEAGAYWECHEALEPLWLRARGLDRHLLGGVILLAAALHKAREMASARGGRRNYAKALAHLALLPDAFAGVAVRELEARVHRALRDPASHPRIPAAPPEAGSVPGGDLGNPAGNQAGNDAGDRAGGASLSPPERRDTLPHDHRRARRPAMPGRLQRSRRDRVIAGVAGGLAEFTEARPRLVRALLLLSLPLTLGVSAVAYALLWLLLPAAPRPE